MHEFPLVVIVTQLPSKNILIFAMSGLKQTIALMYKFKVPNLLRANSLRWLISQFAVRIESYQARRNFLSFTFNLICHSRWLSASRKGVYVSAQGERVITKGDRSFKKQF